MNERERGGARRWDRPDDPDAPGGAVARDTGTSRGTELMRGPMGPNVTTESIGDPRADDLGAGAARGAAAGGTVGLAVAGPLGLIPGAVAGAAVGTAHEATDGPEDIEPPPVAGVPGSIGTGPDDPRFAPELQPRPGPQARRR
jgi:hypothetical protein